MDSKTRKIIGSVLILVLVLGGGFYLFKKYVGTLNIPSKVPIPEENGAGTGDNGSASLPGFTVPEGFSLSIFAKNVPGARAIEIDSKGRILVSETDKGKIVALSDKNNDNVADEQKTIVSGLDNPHGLAFHCHATCTLYVAESGALTSFDYDDQNATVSNKTKVLDIAHSSTDRHFTRSLLFLPSPNEHTLLISVGSSCDACHEKDTDHAAILSYDINTKKKEVYATGLRNSVFMTLNPVSGKVYATEMGHDNLGDDIPPDEINVIEKGKNYGWPNCYGKNIHDTVFDKNTYIRNPCMEPFETQSFVDLQAHSAPLGLSFIPEEGWPEGYWYSLLVAYHGSWNRSTPTGYKIVRIKMNAKGEYLGTEDFITGWLTKGGTKVGRPADIKVLSGGVAYISDDSTGVIYILKRK